jgi:hypothetical protein
MWLPDCAAWSSAVRLEDVGNQREDLHLMHVKQHAAKNVFLA